jgi:hypothetical protein
MLWMDGCRMTNPPLTEQEWVEQASRVLAGQTVIGTRTVARSLWPLVAPHVARAQTLEAVISNAPHTWTCPEGRFCGCWKEEAAAALATVDPTTEEATT